VIYLAELKVVGYFPYRKGQIRGKRVLEFPIESFRDFQSSLEKLAGVTRDNHVCYLVQVPCAWQEPQIVAYMFSDLTMYEGDQVEAKSW